MKKIIHAVSIDAPRDKVFDAVATENGLASWWSTRVDASEEAEIHFTFEGDFNPVMEILDREENDLVRWKCTAGHEPWQDDTLSFRLEEDGKRSHLLFTQDYARELSDEAYGTYNFNWVYYLGRLKQNCETGRGKPFEPGRR